MKIVKHRIKVVFLLVVLTGIAGTRAVADLIWNWTYAPSTIDVSPSDPIPAFGFVSNNISSTQSLTIGIPVIQTGDWTDNYDLGLEDNEITLSPGESTTFLFGTFTPKGPVPVGVQFIFGSFMHARIGIDPIGDALAPDQDLSVTVIPEPTTLILFLVATIVLTIRELRDYGLRCQPE